MLCSKDVSRLFKLFKLKQVPIEVLDEGLVEEADFKSLGMFYYDPPKIVIASEAEHTAKKTTQRQTLAHELGHLLFHKMLRNEERIVERYSHVIERLLNEID